MKAFFGGMPTGVDVRKIDSAFQNLAIGDEVAHDDMERVLGIARTQSRYRTVTNAWRKSKLRDGVEIGAVASVGFRVLSEVERVNGGWKGAQQGIRKSMRSIKRGVVVRTEEPSLVKKQDLLRRLGAAISAEATAVIREIEPPKPQQQMPKRPKAEE